MMLSVDRTDAILYGQTPARESFATAGSHRSYDLRQGLELLAPNTCLYLALDCSKDADLSREGFNARVLQTLCDECDVPLDNDALIHCDGFCGVEAVPTVFTIKHEQQWAQYDLDKMREWGGASGSSKVRVLQEIEREIREGPDRPAAVLLLSHSLYDGPNQLIEASEELQKIAPLAALISHDDQDPSWSDLDFVQKCERICSRSHAGAQARLIPTYLDDELEDFLGEVIHELAQVQADMLSS